MSRLRVNQFRYATIVFGTAVLSFASCRERQTTSAIAAPKLSIDQLLDVGNSAIRSMQEAAVRRDYDEYFNQYEILRQAYIDTTASLKTSPDDDSKEFLVTLEQWEVAIQAARNAWRSLNAGASYEVEESDLVDPNKLAMAKEIKAKLDDLEDNTSRARKKINDRWAPDEARLDEAIATVQDLRAN